MKTQYLGFALGGLAIGLGGAIAFNGFLARPELAAATTTEIMSVQPDEHPGAAAGEAPDMQEMMDEWMKAMTPGPHHEALQHFVGNWDTTTRVWWQGPEGPPIETKGTSEVKFVLGDRYLVEHMSGTFMMPGADGNMNGMPWNGIGMVGYDNVRNMYFSTWADNFTTALHVMRGSSHDGEVFTYYGEMDEPSLGVYGRTIKARVTVKDENSHVFEMIDLHAGDNYKVFEIEYTRQ